MGFVVALVVKELFAQQVRKELERSGNTQHPVITGIGLVALQLL